jgi:hypothetical protein
MKLSGKDMLKRLGRSEPIGAVDGGWPHVGGVRRLVVR